jgi:hypothetical protein
MYKLPKDFDGTFFIGRTLQNVSYSENTVFFGFDENVSVTATSSLQHEIPGDKESLIQKVPLTESKLMKLPGHCIVKASGDEEGTLTLVFDNEHVLKVFNDDPHYECYSINNGKQEIYV